KKRGAFGIAQNHWLSLANAKEKISKNDLTLILVEMAGIEPACNERRMHASTEPRLL
ncbi:MAG: hypothetical protein UY69_C0002G0001, partial [Parcubacteria group bacterium GW2011_GWF1_52_5]